jgi:carboxylesterase type B
MYLLGIISLALITMPLTIAGLSSMKKETLSTIQIRLRNGQILKGNRNLITETQNEQNQYIVYEFLSVPFAQAPLNEKRFQFPFKLDTLLTNDLYDATKFKDSCVQELDTTFPGFSGSEMWNAPGGISEDCLYMNIWVPVKKDQDQLLKTESSKSYPEYISNGFSLNSEDKATLFWIYGGSFSSGSVNLNVYDGNLLAGLENVILVSPNYRLGPFGFLYLNSEKAPGNAGLADITLALEWFRNNYLEFFGGSLNKICL